MPGHLTGSKGRKFLRQTHEGAIKTMNSRKYLYLLTGLVAANAAYADVSSSVGVEAAYDDNIYRLEKREVDSWVNRIRPSVTLEAGGGSAAYELQMDAETGIYTKSKQGDDDYTDYQMKGIADLNFDEHNAAKFILGQKYGHDDRGTSRMDAPNKFTFNNIEEPDEWRENAVRGEYNYGATDARGRMTLKMGHATTDYINNGPETDSFDRENNDMGLVGFIKVLPKTSVLLEARLKDVDYDKDAPSDRDSDDVFYFVGAEWDATAKTSGSFRFGYQEKDTHDDAFDDFEATAWELNMRWVPKEYSSFEIFTSRGYEDSRDTLSFIDHKIYSLRWNHKWSSRLSSALFAERDSEEYEDGSTREDDTDTWGFSATYEPVKHVKLHTEYNYEDRESTAAGLDYERNVVLVGAELAFE